MKKSLLLVLLMMFVSALTYGQNRKISGKITDRDTKEALMQVTVQLLKTDSTFVKGALSNENGEFSLTAPANGRYLVKVTSIGYKRLIKNITVSGDKNVALGKLEIAPDAIMLKGVTATGHAAKMQVKEDTFIYNANAYRTPEGSTIDALVERIPGAQIDESGKITINGKTVSKIKVDGKEFMTGDTETALKNLPANIVDRIKAYDEKSDLARVTGIDDGNEQTVLDFGLKPGMNHGFFSNADVAMGTKDRYSSRLMAGLFDEELKLMMFGNANNVGDNGFGRGGRGFGRRGGGGLQAPKMLGVNMNYDNGKTLQLDGGIRWNHSDSDVRTLNSTENTGTQLFSNSVNRSYSRSDSWNGNLRLEWKPDTMTNIMFRPSFSYSTNDSRSANSSATFNSDPYAVVTDPLSNEGMAELVKQEMAVNSNLNNSISNGENKRVNASLQLNRRLDNRGRNVTLRGEMSYSKNDNTSLSISNVHLYQVQTAAGTDSTYQTNRYNLTPTKNWNYNVQTTYSEPIARAVFLQFSYKYNYSYSKSDRSTYDFSNLGESFFAGITPVYGGWNSYLGRLENPLDTYLNKSLSRFSEYKNYIHDIELMLRVIRRDYDFHAGVLVQPQKTNFIQEYQNISVDTTRHVTNVTPTMELRYRFSRVSNLRLNYRGSTSQPNMTDLLDITDDSNPLSITKGNPGLKPSFTNNFDLFYNNFVQSHQRSGAVWAGYNTTRNGIARAVTYDATTGGQISRPENINGNWNTWAGGTFSFSVDSAGVWNVNTMTNLSYGHSVGYMNQNRSTRLEDLNKSITKTLGVHERLATSYRTQWFEVELNGELRYNRNRNNLMAQNDLDTWEFNYGGNINLTAPWGTGFSTELHMNSRRGYNDNSMNTNELVWNAQISQSFLRGKPLSVMLQFYDILHNQSNYSRAVDAYRRSDTQYNTIHSYAMLHINYRLNIFGGKVTTEMPDGPGGRDGRGGREGRGRGGFGGPGGGRGGFGGFGGGRRF